MYFDVSKCCYLSKKQQQNKTKQKKMCVYSIRKNLYGLIENKFLTHKVVYCTAQNPNLHAPKAKAITRTRRCASPGNVLDNGELIRLVERQNLLLAQ